MSDRVKRAYVVVGPESSGNKLLTALLIRAGCVGDPRDDGPGMWSIIEPATEQRVALTYSFPHGQEWPDLRNVYWRLQNKGYLTWFLVAARDPWCVFQSQEQRRLKPMPVAMANYQRSYREIFTQLHAIDAPYLMVPYEAITSEPEKSVQRLLELLSLPTDNLGGQLIINSRPVNEITNENAKHYR